MTSMEAGFRLATGDHHEAGRLSEALIGAAGGEDVQAAVVRVEAAFRGQRSLPPGFAEELEALIVQEGTSGNIPRLRRAALLAHALEGDFQGAFKALESARENAADLWSLAAEAAPDDDFLPLAAEWAAGAAGLSLPDPARHRIAERLFDHGFPDLALRWLPEAREGEAEQISLLRAAAHLALGDAKGAIAASRNLGSDAAEELMARSALQLGAHDAAAILYRRAGREEEFMLSKLWSGDWPAVHAHMAAPWRDLAGAVLASHSDPQTLTLEELKAVADEGARLRAAVAEVVRPPPRFP